MRDLRRRLPLISLGALGGLIALILAGTFVFNTEGSLLGFGQSPAEKVSLQGSDLPPGMNRCAVTGRPEGKGSPPFGAMDVWTVIYADACNLPPSRRYAFSWVLDFESESAAVAGYKTFIGSQDCTIVHGCVDWGLGQNFNLNCGPLHDFSQSDAGCLGTWQRKAFVLTFQGIMGIDDAKKAVLGMDARAIAVGGRQAT